MVERPLLPFFLMFNSPRIRASGKVGLMFPFSMELTERIGLGLMSEFDTVYNDVTLRHEFSYLYTAVLGIDLTDRLGIFIEHIGVVGEAPYEAYGSGGFTFSVNDHLILDCGARIGLNRAAEEVGMFVGFTKRF